MPKIVRNEVEYCAGPSSISSLGDTTITNPANGDLLQYNGTKWVNSSNQISYKSGDVINIGDIIVVGWVTGGRQNIRFTIALPKSLPDNFTITPSGKARMYSSTGFNMFASGTNLTSMGSFTFSKVASGVSVLITFNSAFSQDDVPNNAPTIIYLESTARLTLS